MSTRTIESFAQSVVSGLDASESASELLKLRIKLLRLAADLYSCDVYPSPRARIQAQLFQTAYCAVEAVFLVDASLFPDKDPKVGAVQDVSYIHRPKDPNTSLSRVAERLVSLAYVLACLPSLPVKTAYLVPSRARDVLRLAVPLLNSVDFSE